MSLVTAADLEEAASHLMQRAEIYSNIAYIRRFRCTFGTSPTICSLLRTLSADELPYNKKPGAFLS